MRHGAADRMDPFQAEGVIFRCYRERNGKRFREGGQKQDICLFCLFQRDFAENLLFQPAKHKKPQKSDVVRSSGGNETEERDRHAWKDTLPQPEK